LAHLKGIAKLQTLSLRKTKVTDKGVADLKKAQLLLDLLGRRRLQRLAHLLDEQQAPVRKKWSSDATLAGAATCWRQTVGAPAAWADKFFRFPCPLRRLFGHYLWGA
jgi:hypothetical protein